MLILKPRFLIDSKIQKYVPRYQNVVVLNRFNIDKITQCAPFYEHNIILFSRIEYATFPKNIK